MSADTYLDVSSHVTGFVRVSCHNLGRCWNIGSQTRLYCPARWLNTGRNEILLLDLHCAEPGPLRRMKTVEQESGYSAVVEYIAKERVDARSGIQ